MIMVQCIAFCERVKFSPICLIHPSNWSTLTCANTHINITCARQWLGDKPKSFTHTCRRQLEYHSVIIFVLCSLHVLYCLIFICYNVFNLTIWRMRWKCCRPICIEMHRSFRGLRPLDPTLQGLRALRASNFCAVRKRFRWGTQPSLAHGHPRAKLRHCQISSV